MGVPGIVVWLFLPSFVAGVVPLFGIWWQAWTPPRRVFYSCVGNRLGGLQTCAMGHFSGLARY